MLKFDARPEILACNNLMGRARPELAPNLRCWNVGKYVLFYRPIKDGIELIPVLHSARDITAEFFEGVD